MRDPRMARRMSQAPPRMSIVFNTPISLSLEADDIIEMAEEQGEIGKAQMLRVFCENNVKTISTFILILGMVFCIVMIVMVHKWNFENANGSDWGKDKQGLKSSTTPPEYSYFIHDKMEDEDWV